MHFAASLNNKLVISIINIIIIININIIIRRIIINIIVNIINICVYINIIIANCNYSSCVFLFICQSRSGLFYHYESTCNSKGLPKRFQQLSCCMIKLTFLPRTMITIVRTPILTDLTLSLHLLLSATQSTSQSTSIRKHFKATTYINTYSLQLVPSGNVFVILNTLFSNHISTSSLS